MDETLTREATAFLEAEWPAVLADLEQLVSIDSSEDRAAATETAPYGPGPRAALDATFSMLRGYGFEPHDCEGRCGYFDVGPRAGKQLGVIGHLDVVPAGEGWTHEPFVLTCEDGWLVGRGVADDKGPLLMAIHALRFWRDRFARGGEEPPVSVRVILGCAEETGMEDADYYIERYGAPDFLFTPDAEFPLCYGEKGHFQARLTSADASAEGGCIERFEGGSALNGVPGTARAVVRCGAKGLPQAERVTVEPAGAGKALVTATGVAGHAAMPEGSVNAVGLLASYLLEQCPLSAGERAWLEFVAGVAGTTDGSALGIACADDDFEPLTCVASIASLAGGRFSQCVDVRFPTTASVAQLTAAFEARAARLGANVEVIYAVDPLLVPSDSAEVGAFRRAYEQVTGCEACLFTMGGGTYAHHFPRAVSFGAMDDARFPRPERYGGMHAADEAVAEDCLKQALLIYIAAFGEFFELWGDA